MQSKNLSEMNERELEYKEKTSKTGYYFMVGVGIVGTLIVAVSSYVSKQLISWWTWLFVTFFPLYMAFRAKKELNDIKTEFKRRRYR